MTCSLKAACSLHQVQLRIPQDFQDHYDCLEHAGGWLDTFTLHFFEGAAL